MEKPPLGIRPQFIVLEQRLNEINEALYIHLKAGVRIHTEWIEERNEIIEALKKTNS